MPRRLTGSIRAKDDTFEASVPERRGSSQRIYEYFSTRTDAEHWCAAAVQAIYDGRPVPPASEVVATPQRDSVERRETGSVGERHFFARAAKRAHAEQYEELRAAGPDRAAKVDDLIRLHVVPFFTTMCARPQDFSRALVIAFLLRLTGSRQATYPTEDAAAIAGVSERRIRRMLQKGQLGEAGRDQTGRRLVRLGELEAALGVPRLRAAYAHDTVKGILGVLRQIETYMVAQRVIDRAVSGGLQVPRIDPAALRRPKRDRSECVPVDEVAVVARSLHIVHQLVLWLMRICGLRISEAYGIRVGDVLESGDGDRPGIISIERQGGMAFLHYDEYGDVVAADSKDELKNDGSVRVLVVPAVLMKLVRLVIAVFHTDPDTGRVDLDARLVPGIQRPGVGGQAAFRTALANAVGDAAGAGDIEARFVPHDMRAALITDLAHSDVDELVRRRFVGHLPGHDVHAGYIRKLRENPEFLTVAQQVDELVCDSVGSLIVPTAKFPQFGRHHPAYARRDEIRCALVEVGSLLEHLDDAGDPMLDAAEVALELGCHESHARRLMRHGALPVKEGAGGRRVAHADLEAWKAQRLPNLADFAERHGVDYHRLHRIRDQLGLELERDPVTGDYAVTDDSGTQLLDEVRRVDELKARACTVADAARQLRKAHSTVRKLIRTGELDIDPETDASDARFITNDSIERYLRSAG